MLLIRTLAFLAIIPFSYSQSSESMFNLGESQLASGDLASAELSFNSALDIDPSFAPALQGLSKLYLHKGDLKMANEFSIQAVQKDEGFRDWATKISKITENIQNGTRNVQQGKFEEAMAEYDAISKEYPYFPDAEFYKGLTRFRQKDIESAAKYFRNALSIYPEHQKARKGLDNVTKQFLNAGNKAYKRGDITKAIDYYEKA